MGNREAGGLSVHLCLTLIALAAAALYGPNFVIVSRDLESFMATVYLTILQARALGHGEWIYWISHLGLGMSQPFAQFLYFHPVQFALQVLSCKTVLVLLYWSYLAVGGWFVFGSAWAGSGLFYRPRRGIHVAILFGHGQLFDHRLLAIHHGRMDDAAPGFLLGESFFLEKMMRGHGRITGPEHERFLTGMLDHIKGCFEAFAEAVPALAALFPDRTIVLRPHPSENHDRWREIVEGVRNVTVVHEGNVAPWLMACSALVHNSCTTAVEMAALGRRAVAYRPRVSEDFEPALPALVSESAFTLDQLKTAVAVAVQGADTFAGGEPLLEHYVSGYQGKYSCEILVSALWRAARDAGPSSWRVGQRLRWHSRSSYQRILHAVSRLMGRQDRLEAYKKQKFPGLEEAEVRALIALYANASGRFGSLGVSGMPNVPRAVRIRAQDSEGGVRAASV